MINASLRTHIHNNLPEEFEDKEFVSNQLDLFVSSSLVKFVKGQKEHGGSILRPNRNLFQEAHNEIIDLNFYLGAIRKKVNSCVNALELELSLNSPKRESLEQILHQLKSI